MNTHKVGTVEVETLLKLNFNHSNIKVTKGTLPNSDVEFTCITFNNNNNEKI